MKLLILDFETKNISDVPDGQAPEPVGMALSRPRDGVRYMAWGHPTGNNCTIQHARAILFAAVERCDTLVCHNIGFDVSVAHQHMGIILDHLRWHDTQVMAFHADPHSPSLGLKQLAERYLKMPPEERDAVNDWLIDQKIVRRNAIRQLGANIWQAPGDLVGPYAIGDVLRTRALFQHWQAKYVGQEGYERDMRATRVGLRMTERGVLLDVPLLKETTARAQEVVEKTHQRIATLFGLSSYDPDDKEAKADAIERTFGINLPLTATGKRAVNKDVLFDSIPEGEIKALLRYAAAVGYDVKNYLLPWQRAVEVTGGRIHPQWSVTRSDNGGARSGRLSSSPNFQNLRGEETTAALVEYLQKMMPSDWWTPPIRGLVIAPPGKRLVGRDYSQIELRLVAHYEDGPMAANYRSDPEWDLHAWVMERVETLFGAKLPRRIAKNIGFGSIYGAGAAPISKQSRITIEEAYAFREMYFKALPSLRDLMDEVQETAKLRPITTLGNRTYTAEAPRFDPALGRLMRFEYKMLNYLIQPSAADLMKEAMIDCEAYGLPLVLSVHDEPVSESDDNDAMDHLEAMRVAMEHNDLVERITVPIISNGYVTDRWSDAK